MTDRFDRLDPPQAPFRTHEVSSMTPALAGYNLFDTDAALVDAVTREGAGWAGVLCPTTMTYASVPALRRQPDLAAAWEPRILSRRYDPRFLPWRRPRRILHAPKPRDSGDEQCAEVTSLAATGRREEDGSLGSRLAT